VGTHVLQQTYELNSIKNVGTHVLKLTHEHLLVSCSGGVVGGIYSPNHQTSRLVKLSVRWRTGQSGATATSPKAVGVDHWSSVFWARLDVRWRTGHAL
jgi:hypothetical protein